MWLFVDTLSQVCFKIKTTAPKRYCVKPNSGVVDPNNEVQIAVSLQPFEWVFALHLKENKVYCVAHAGLTPMRRTSTSLWCSRCLHQMARSTKTPWSVAFSSYSWKQKLSWETEFILPDKNCPLKHVYDETVAVEGDWPEWPDGQQAALRVCYASCPGNKDMPPV